MEHSDHRILTTHGGSIPRPETLAALLVKQEQGDPIDSAEMAQEVDQAVADVVEQQINCGIDIGNDGEQPRIGFQTYVTQRMTGFGGASQRRPPADFMAFGQFAQSIMSHLGDAPRAKVFDAPQAMAEIAYNDFSAVAAECGSLARAIEVHSDAFTECFMTAASPGIIATTLLNDHYDSHADYVAALSREMKKEYNYIVDRGFILQIDAPDLAMERAIMYQDISDNEFKEIVELHVSAINDALEGIPPDRVRLHCCWGNWAGPHVHDVALELILPIIYEARVGALNLGFANPRHQHELELLKTSPPPEGMILIAGVIDVTTHYVEHPEVVANRVCEAVDVMGDANRVIAGTDCVFGSFVGFEALTHDIIWAKLAALREGANIASSRLGL